MTDSTIAEIPPVCSAIAPPPQLDASNVASHCDDRHAGTKILSSPTGTSSPNETVVDIEHAYVADDPLLWPSRRKVAVVAVVASAAIAPTLSISIYNPAFSQIQQELHATSQEIALSLSLYILVQGGAPLLWSAISEIKGRKPVYLVSTIFFAAGTAAAGTAKDMGVLIAMRMLQAAGTSSLLSLGAASIADVYEPHQRGTVIGIYYAMPLLGPAIGPIIGGLLTDAFSWRATFYFLLIFAGLSFCTFFFLPDTFRRERSLAYQSARKRAIAQALERHGKHQSTTVLSEGEKDEEKMTSGSGDRDRDVEKGVVVTKQDEIKLTLADVRPLGAAWLILRRRSNAVMFIPTALLFAFTYGITYTCARTFARAPYSYTSTQVGLILLSFGIGNIAGSIFGGRWSDRTLARLKAANGGVSTPEMRLESTKPLMLLLPPSVLAYGWLCQKHVYVAAPAVMLFLSGFASIWIYSSTLAYLVDANKGRSSTAVATNSTFRGLAGLVIAEISAPIQDAIGDGGLYTIWAGLLVVMAVVTLVVSRRGAGWREIDDRRDVGREKKEMGEGTGQALPIETPS